MSPTRMSASGLRSCATATSRAAASIPAQTAPRSPASSMASPEPQATSSSRSPSSTSSRWWTATYSRQLLGSDNVAKSAASRPHPSSTPRQSCEPSCRLPSVGRHAASVRSTRVAPTRCAHSASASGPTPASRLDRRRRVNGSPSTYMPGTASTPPSWRIAPAAVEQRRVEPGVAGLVPGGPDHGGEPGEIQLGHRRGQRGRVGRSGGPTRSPRPCSSTWASMRSSSRACLRSAALIRFASEPENWARPRATPTKPAGELDARRGQRGQVEGAPLRRAHQLQRRQPPGPDQVLDLVVALVEDAQLVHPPVDVAAAVGPRHPHVVADRDGHRPPGPPQLVGDLHARRRGAHDQHRARRDLPGLAVAAAR